LDIDYFTKQDRLDKLLVCIPLIFGIIIAACVYFICRNYTNGSINIIAGAVMGGIGLICTAVFALEYAFTAKITVNTRDLTFWINNNKYYFNDLMPEFDVLMSSNTKFLTWFRITLYFKDGQSKRLFLAQCKAVHFIDKYLSYYSRANRKLKLFGIPFPFYNEY